MYNFFLYFQLFFVLCDFCEFVLVLICQQEFTVFFCELTTSQDHHWQFIKLVLVVFRVSSYSHWITFSTFHWEIFMSLTPAPSGRHPSWLSQCVLKGDVIRLPGWSSVKSLANFFCPVPCRIHVTVTQTGIVHTGVNTPTQTVNTLASRVTGRQCYVSNMEMCSF